MTNLFALELRLLDAVFFFFRGAGVAAAAVDADTTAGAGAEVVAGLGLVAGTETEVAVSLVSVALALCSEVAAAEVEGVEACSAVEAFELEEALVARVEDDMVSW